MDPSASIATLLDRKVYYFVMPLLPGGLLVSCILAGKLELRSVLLYSEGFGYVFRMSILLSVAWVLGGILFLVSSIVVEAATGITSGLSESKETQKPWNITLWQRVVTATFGPDLVVNNNYEHWRNFPRGPGQGLS